MTVNMNGERFRCDRDCNDRRPFHAPASPTVGICGTTPTRTAAGAELPQSFDYTLPILRRPRLHGRIATAPVDRGNLTVR